jgi:putative ABC transport system ATP-binding protein
LTVRGNILFGALAYGQAHAQADVASLVAEIVDELDMRHAISRLGLSFAVGTAGARLSLAQRQRVVIARALLKRPDLLIVNEAANALDPNSQRILVDRVKERMKGLGILWVLERPDLAEKFEQVMVLEGGRVVEQGRFDELASAESKLSVILTG